MVERWSSVQLTQSLQTVFQLSEEHCAVLLFVVQLQTLHEVLEATLILLNFDLLESSLRKSSPTQLHHPRLLVRRWEGILRL